MYLQGDKEYISLFALSYIYIYACMMTLTLKSYSGQLIFDPDSIVSSLILQSNIINLLYLIVQEKFSLFTHTDRLGAEGMQQVHPPHS